MTSLPSDCRSQETGYGLSLLMDSELDWTCAKLHAMNRRGFLQVLGIAVGGIALEQAIPFNRVWSFPKNIVIPKNHSDYVGVYNEAIKKYSLAWCEYANNFEIGQTIRVPMPEGVMRFTITSIPGIMPVEPAFSVSAVASHTPELLGTHP